MSTPTASTRRGTAAAKAPRRAPSSERRKQLRRRRIGFLALVALVAAVVAASIAPWADDAVQEVTLPLRHDDIIRQQARDKNLDPALIAGVIFAESHFRDQTSHAGAKGLMQIMPATADHIAEKSGGTAFVQGDLATPQVNIAYGSWYLRYLLDRYDDRVMLALAAYNAGEGNVDGWLADARAGGGDLQVRDIPFPETQGYVQKVLRARDDYRRTYPRELGL